MTCLPQCFIAFKRCHIWLTFMMLQKFCYIEEGANWLSSILSDHFFESSGLWLDVWDMEGSMDLPSHRVNLTLVIWGHYGYSPVTRPVEWGPWKRSELRLGGCCLEPSQRNIDPRRPGEPVWGIQCEIEKDCEQVRMERINLNTCLVPLNLLSAKIMAQLYTVFYFYKIIFMILF